MPAAVLDMPLSVAQAAYCLSNVQVDAMVGLYKRMMDR